MVQKFLSHVLNHKWSYGFALLSVSYLLVPLLVINGSLIFNTDEYCLTFDALNRLCGVPLECSAWPGGTLQFLSFPIIMAHIFKGMLSSGLSVEALVAQYADAYFTVDTYISIIRIVNVLVFISVLVFVFHAVVKQANNLSHKIIILLVFLLFITNSEVTLSHWTATADSMASSFSFLSLALLLFSSWKYKTGFAGIALGLAIACKVTYLINVPFFLVLLLLHDKAHKGKNLLYFILCFLLAFFMVCPYIWTDSLRILKSVAGNITRAGSPIGISIAYHSILEVLSLVLPFLFVLFCFFLRKKESLAVALTAVVLVLVNVLLASRAGVFYPRYYLPITLVLVITLLYIIPDLLLTNKKYARLFIGVLILSVGIQAYFEIQKTTVLVHRNQRIRQDIASLTTQLVSLKQDKKILVPYELMYEMTSICSSETFGDLLNAMEKTDPYVFFKQAKLSESAYHSLEFALLDEEMSFQQRLRIFKWNTKGKTNIRFYSDNIAQQQRFGLKAIKDYKEDGLYIVCTKDRDPIKSAAQSLYETTSYVLYRTGM